MIGFELSDEQRDFRDLAHRFAEDTIRPAAVEADEKEEVPWDVLKKAHQVGLTTFTFPEKYGGGGIDSVLTKTLVDEELFWGCAGVGTILGGLTLAATPVELAGDDAQKEHFYSRVCDPSKVRLAAFGLSEPGAGSNPAGMTTIARRVGDKYILNGQKTFITNAGISDVYTVFATLDTSRGANAICAFIVDADTPGVIPGKKEKKMGIKASHTSTLTFDNAEVPCENRLGEEGEGFRIAMKTFDITRTAVAIGGVGVARAAYEYALRYAHERKQFGQPIYNHQAVSFMIADMATQIDAARMLCWRAAWLRDNDLPCTLEASMAKSFSADVAMKVTTDAVQVLGGYGYMRDYPVEKWMRDAKIMQIYEGTAQIQRVIISRRLSESMSA